MKSLNNELFNFVDREAITFKLDKVIETYSSITKTSHKCDYVYISPPYDFYTKSGYKKPITMTLLKNERKLKCQLKLP